MTITNEAFSFFQQKRLGITFSDLKNKNLNAMSEGNLSKRTSCSVPNSSPAFFLLPQDYYFFNALSFFLSESREREVGQREREVGQREREENSKQAPCPGLLQGHYYKLPLTLHQRYRSFLELRVGGQ